MAPLGVNIVAEDFKSEVRIFVRAAEMGQAHWYVHGTREPEGSEDKGNVQLVTDRGVALQFDSILKAYLFVTSSKLLELSGARLSLPPAVPSI